MLLTRVGTYLLRRLKTWVLVPRVSVEESKEKSHELIK